MSMQFADEIDWFGEQMKLRMGQAKNLGKAQWSTLDAWDLYNKAYHELTKELSAAIDSGDLQAVISGAGDGANFLMMIADNARNGLLVRKEPTDD